MNVTCPHCHESIELSTRENQTVAGCHKCNGTFKIEVLNPCLEIVLIVLIVGKNM